MKKIKNIVSLLLLVVLFGINTPLVSAAAITWTQTDWSGGSGQASWSVTNKYDSQGSDGVYDTTANQLKMQIAAQTVVGQSNFTTGTSQNTLVSGVSAYGFYNPISSIVVGSKLIVVDYTNNRVLIYNTIPTSATSADVVIGQPNMTSNSANQGGSVAANTLSGPRGIYSDGTKLFIADSSNNRVLIYNTIPTSDNASADVVIGQADFTHGSANQGGSVAANTLSLPDAIASNGTKLFIEDDSNNRVLIYNTVPLSNNASADVAVGQPDLVSNTGNNGGLGANTLWFPRNGLAVTGTKLIISDGPGNNRVLVFNTIPIANGASADVVIGQADFTHGSANQGGSVAANTLNGPFSVHTDGTKLFIADLNNNRVLIYNTIPTSNNASADVVIGQADFTHSSGGVTASTLNFPSDAYSSGTKFFVSDNYNNRVLIYNSIPVSNNASAEVVLGQINLNNNFSNAAFTFSSANSLYQPGASIVVNGKLIVADFQNSRVLIYNTIPVSNNASADVVIGQADFTRTSTNQGGSVAANTFCNPASIFSDGVKLFVTDPNNNRVLIYNTIPTSNNASADVVIGQADFTHAAANQGGAVGANTLAAPYGVSLNGAKLFIADSNNHRVLIYNTIPTSNNASADVVIGQADFTHNTVNQGLGSNVTAKTLNSPKYALSNGTELFVSDSTNNRVLIYNTIPISNNTSADVVIGQADFAHCTANRGVLGGRGNCNTTNFTAVTANTLYAPYFLFSDGTSLYIPDLNNNRILIYNTIPVSNGVGADAVIGQADFTHMAANGGSTTKGNFFAAPFNVFSDGTNFLVSDSGNSRLLIFSGSHQSTLTSSTYDAGTPYTWGPLTYTATTPANTAISFEVSTDGGTTWVPVTNNTTQTFGPSNTVTYRATLSNTDGISTPTLTGVSIGGNLLPTVSTLPASAITRNDAVLNGEINNTGGSDATTRGFEYGLTTSYGTTTTESTGPYGTGTFTTSLDFHCERTYHYRAYATNIVGTSYGSDVSFTTPICAKGSGGGGGTSVSTPSSITPTTPPTTSVTTCTITQTLKKGSKGEEVKCLQTKLNILSDGLFGKLTKAAVIKFQLANKLVGDGIVGPITRGILNK